MRTRRFDAAAGGRRWQGSQTFGAINSEIGAAAAPVRRRASYFARNSVWLSNGISALVTGSVGAGIKPMSQHRDRAVRDVLHRAWRTWAPDADADGLTDFYGQQALAVRSLIETGETFARLISTPAGLRVQLLDPAMVPLDETRELGDGRRIVQGIELADDGRRLAFWVHRERPDVVPSFSNELVRVPADSMAHLLEPIACGQLRGISRTASLLLRLHEIDLWEDAALVRAKTSALFAGFITDVTGSAFSGETTAPGVLTTGLEPGTLKVLPPGTDIRFSEPAQMGDAVDFLKLQLRSIAAGLGVPEHLVTNDLSAASYSSLRAGLIEYRARLEQLQHHVIVPMFLRPVWRAFVLNEVLAGRVDGDLDELLQVEWITPAQPWVDPQKDAEAARLALAAGLTSRRREVAALGWDVEELDAEIAADKERERVLGLRFDTSETPKPATPLRMVPNAA